MTSQANSFPTAEELRHSWSENPRWRRIIRGYQPEDLVRLRGSIVVAHSIARLTCEKLWRSLEEKPFVNALGGAVAREQFEARRLTRENPNRHRAP